MASESNGWDQHKRLVEAELNRGSSERKEIMQKMDRLFSSVSTHNAFLESLKDDILQNRENIKYLVQCQTEQEKKLSSLETELKIKAGFWGALGAAVPTAIAVIFILVSN